MNNEEEKKCPLCAEEMDWTDQQLKPCKCGYEVCDCLKKFGMIPHLYAYVQVCVWCWHHIMEMAEKDENEGRCPACRTPYDKERIVGMEANCKRVVTTKKDKKSKPQKAKPKKPEVSKDLSGVRVIQRKMAYIIGLPLSLADENLLQRKEFFGQYGKVSKVSLSRTAGGAIQQFVNESCSVYVTYSKEEEAIRCIQSIHGFVLEGRFLRASFGTAKYCHAWLRNLPCTNTACLYLHSIGAEEDSFSKDEEAAVHTRNRVHQIVGATHNMQRRSGNMLPPPLDDPLNGNGVATDKAIVGSALKDTAHASLTSNGHLNCSLSCKDQDGRIKTPNKTFVDIVGGSSCGPEKNGSVAEDSKILNLCSDFSSVTIEEANHLETEYSNSTFKKVSSSCHLPIELPGDKDSHEFFIKPFRESSKFSMFERPYFQSNDACIGNGHSYLMSDSERQVLPGSCSEVREDFLSFAYQRSKGSDSSSQGSSVLSSCPVRIPDRSYDHAQQRKETHAFSDYNMERSTVHNHVDEASVPFTYVNSALIDGYNERNFQSSAELDGNLRRSNSFSNEEIVEHLRRLDDNDIANNGDTSALDVVESSIISNILSMDFDSCNDSLTSSHSLAELLDGTGGRHGSWNFRNSDESRFSFAKKGNYVNQEPDLDSSFSSIGQASKKYSSLPDSMEKEEHYSWGPQNHVSRAQSLIPPGFSVPSREPPPGFPPRERTNHVTSGNHLVKTSSLPNGQYLVGSTSNIINNFDFDFVDPAIMVVGSGKSTKTLNSTSNFEGRPSPTPQTYEDEARLWLLMQQSASSTHQDPTFPSTFVQETPTAVQEFISPGQIGNGFSPMGDTFGLTPMLMDPHHSYNPSPVPQLSQQKYSNGHMSNCYGGLGLDEARLRNEMGGAEIQRNERLGLNKFFPGYGGDLVLQMPSTGDVFNRVYGL